MHWSARQKNFRILTTPQMIPYSDPCLRRDPERRRREPGRRRVRLRGLPGRCRGGGLRRRRGWQLGRCVRAQRLDGGAEGSDLAAKHVVRQRSWMQS